MSNNQSNVVPYQSISPIQCGFLSVYVSTAQIEISRGGKKRNCSMSLTLFIDDVLMVSSSEYALPYH